jgi:hypothetical protein
MNQMMVSVMRLSHHPIVFCDKFRKTLPSRPCVLEDYSCDLAVASDDLIDLQRINFKFLIIFHHDDDDKGWKAI